MQAFVPSMWRRNDGHIVAIASVGSFVGVGNFSTYCATKFAVLGKMIENPRFGEAKEND